MSNWRYLFPPKDKENLLIFDFITFKRLCRCVPRETLEEFLSYLEDTRPLKKDIYDDKDVKKRYDVSISRAKYIKKVLDGKIPLLASNDMQNKVLIFPEKQEI